MPGMNERGKELFSEILELCNGVDAVQALTGVSTALAALIINSATEDKLPVLTADVVRTIEMTVAEMRERDMAQRETRQ
jgi:hypothetical protein